MHTSRIDHSLTWAAF